MIFLHGAVDAAQHGASLIQGGARSETAKDLGHAMEAVSDHGRGKVMRTGDHIGDDLGVRGIRYGGFEDADDAASPIAKDAAIKTDGSTDDARVFLERCGPETIGENDHARRFGTV